MCACSVLHLQVHSLVWERAQVKKAFVRVSGQVVRAGAKLPACSREGFKPACKPQ